MLAIVGYFVVRITASDEPDFITAVGDATDALRGIPRAVAMLFIATSSAIFYITLLANPAGILDRDPDLRITHWPAAALALVFVFNGLCPYLGFKTQTSFSNLRTEMAQTNHFFMPSLALTDTTTNLVAVHESSHRKLNNMARAGDLIPFFELRRYATHDPDFTVLYTPWGETDPIFASREGSSDPRAEAVFDTPPLLLRKVIGFRSVPPPDEPCTCRH